MKTDLETIIRKSADTAGISTSENDGSPYPSFAQLALFYSEMHRAVSGAPAVEPLPRRGADWGLFTGRLDSLLIQKRHTERCMELMYKSAAEFEMTEPNRAILERIVQETMDQYHKHGVACREFIAQYGERLTLKDEA